MTVMWSWAQSRFFWSLSLRDNMSDGDTGVKELDSYETRNVGYFKAIRVLLSYSADQWAFIFQHNTRYSVMPHAPEKFLDELMSCDES